MKKRGVEVRNVPCWNAASTLRSGSAVIAQGKCSATPAFPYQARTASGCSSVVAMNRTPRAPKSRMTCSMSVAYSRQWLQSVPKKSIT